MYNFPVFVSMLNLWKIQSWWSKFCFETRCNDSFRSRSTSEHERIKPSLEIEDLEHKNFISFLLFHYFIY